MPLTYGDTGITVYNQCTKCFRFLKFDDCPDTVGFNYEDMPEPIIANCPRCGKVKLDYEFI